MDKFITVSKPSALRFKDQTQVKKATSGYQPYPQRTSRWPQDDQSTSSGPPTTSQTTPAKLTKLLLSTLSHEANPLTHSDIPGRADHVVSFTTGHQVGEGRCYQRKYMNVRSTKLAEQAEAGIFPDEPKILRNTRIYINGYLSDTTDIEMKRIITRAGGQVLRTASGATHILTSQQLSGSKTHKILTSKSCSTVHVVRPEWVTDSIKSGKRLAEKEYSVIKPTNTRTIADIFQHQNRHV